jgi:predicted HicB family RNase H-like nuclease
LHKRLTIEAAERNLSLNQWAIHKLAEHQPA